MPSIYVYGTTSCGYTRQQVSELKDELQTQGFDVKTALHFVECDKEDNAVCTELSGYPLALVHGDDTAPTAAEVAKAPLGKRPATDLVKEWQVACDAPAAPAAASSIYVYGTTWCGYTRQQVSEVKDALQAEGIDEQALHFVECDKVDNAVCTGLSGYPLALVHGDTPPTTAEVAQAQLGKRPASELVQELHDARTGAKTAPGAKKKAPGGSDAAIYVYGTTWCGYTTQQVKELKTALKGELKGHKESKVLQFINCEQEKDNAVCGSLSGFPLALVHSGPPTPAEAAKVPVGKRSAAELVQQWQQAL
jgi:hypothetical protein